MMRKRHSDPLLMGILNCTPDSFSDGGLFLDHEKAIAHGRQLFKAGADVVDVGGESTRPGADAVTVDEECARIIPVVEQLSTLGPVSVDTRNAETALHAHAVGATWLNDINGLRGEGMLEAASHYENIVIMHMRGSPKTMQDVIDTDTDIMAVLEAFFLERLQAVDRVGIERDRVWLDPGVGFGKNDGQNLSILKHINALHNFGCPIMLGVSRKSFIGRVCAVESPSERDFETHIISSLMQESGGVHALRVHDIGGAFRARAIIRAIHSAR